VPRIDLKHPLATHVCLLASIWQSLRLHDSLHVCTPTIFWCHHYTRSVIQSVGYLHIIDIVLGKSTFPPLGKILKGFLQFLVFSILPEFQTLLRHILELFIFIIHQVLHQVFINWIREVNNLYQVEKKIRLEDIKSMKSSFLSRTEAKIPK